MHVITVLGSYFYYGYLYSQVYGIIFFFQNAKVISHKGLVALKLYIGMWLVIMYMLNWRVYRMTSSNHGGENPKIVATMVPQL